ncbi:WDPCP isoform 5 [Pongo abelii]|uniref:WDPCP isoform 5 n=1 Tax=Pongo abelii TaxID=9601 RepID=A0A2J8XC89_PONAB|nr:WDPCP isoform 5 [Pongo abelii]
MRREFCRDAYSKAAGSRASSPLPRLKTMINSGQNTENPQLSEGTGE